MMNTSTIHNSNKEEQEEDIPDMDTYEDTGDNLVGKSQFPTLHKAKQS